jgi:AcrR family transcriptional regulator
LLLGYLSTGSCPTIEVSLRGAVEEKSEVEQRVLRAARRLFLAQGAARTPLRAVAAEAGTSESGILRFFRDKDDLACAVMDACWVEVNDNMVEALRIGSGRTDDPRSLLIEVVRAVLEHAAADMRATSFLVSHFHYTLSAGSSEKLPEGAQHRLNAYRRYRGMIDDLCGRIEEYDPSLREAGITRAGLCHLTLSLLYGITGGWYLSARDPTVHGPAVPLEDALNVLRKVVYPNGSWSSSETNRCLRAEPKAEVL